MRRKFLVLLALSLLSCQAPQGSPTSSSNPQSEEGVSSSVSAREPSSQTPISAESSQESIEKDEQGFIVLPQGYLTHEERPHSFGADVQEKEKSGNLRLFLGDEPVPIYNVYVNQTHRWDPEAKGRTLAGVASVSVSTGAIFTLACTWVIEGRCKISPSNKNVSLSFDEAHRTVRFELSEPGDYLVEFRGGRALHLFVHEYEEASPYDESNSIYFGPGVHNKNNDSRLRDSTLRISSGATVYLAEGAFVEAAFVSTSASGFRILGKGFVDGSVFDRNASMGSRFIPFDFSDCRDFLLGDFAVLDPAGWCFNLYFCADFKLNRVKVISSRSNGDGISLQSCKRVVVDGCFLRTYDDSIVVKNYPRWNNRSIEGETEDIEVKNCLVYTDLAQCLEVGYETVGEKMERIHFHDIVILAATHKAALSIHNANNAHLKDVRFEDIVIENLQTGQGDGTPLLLEFTVAHSPTWSDQHKVTGLGDIDGVLVKNIRVLSGLKTPRIAIQGSMETRSGYPAAPHKITNVSLENILLQGERLTSEYPAFSLAYAEGITLDGVTIS
ncbi:MAG: hypothetical protein IJS52_00280 [Bacilli bacterium]|nr:hypothetical protein [Bacilli bacterium]